MELVKEKYIEIAMQKGLTKEESELAFDSWMELYVSFPYVNEMLLMRAAYKI